MKARLCYQNGEVKTVQLENRQGPEYVTVYLPREQVGEGCEYVDFLYDGFCAQAGDDGYFVVPLEAQTGIYKTVFTPRADTEYVSVFSCVSCYGWNRGSEGTLAIITGMKYDYGMVAGVKDGGYYLYPRFWIDGDMPYEDVEVRLYRLEPGDYCAMARRYRRYQMEERGCVPLKERVAVDPRLAKSAEAINVRIRQGWKPAPSPVEEQTPETEPPMYAACTFDRAGELAREFKRQGIEHAEFCLVGWNTKGHDGRFPQIFPVEEQLGGEEALLRLIGDVKQLGYGIVCHDDCTGAYRIADCWDEEYIIKNKDGSLYKRPKLWSGGRPYKICPQREFERFEVSNMEKLSAMGFEGIHYIDVITILELLKCYDPAHPCTRKDSAMWYRRIMQLAREKFGGFSSEGCYDFAADSLDFTMYTSFHLDDQGNPPICDEHIPFWQIAYHGIILYNPGTYTLNYPVKKTANRLKYFEYGGRPLAVYYANFMSGDNQDHHWMGREDLLCGTDEQMVFSAKKVRQMTDDYRLMEPVRFAFMDNHEKVADGVFRTTYSNGESVTVDYNQATVKLSWMEGNV